MNRNTIQKETPTGTVNTGPRWAYGKVHLLRPEREGDFDLVTCCGLHFLNDGRGYNLRVMDFDDALTPRCQRCAHHHRGALDHTARLITPVTCFQISRNK